TRIAACLTDISEWMATHHLKLNLDKTELMFLPGKGCPHRDLAITIDNTVVTPTRTVRNLGVILDDQLSFAANVASVARSCRFLLYNIRRIRPFLTDEMAQVLIQALVISRLDYGNSLLAGAPASAIRPLELVQKAAAHLVFNRPKFSHTTPLLMSLHWLPVAARIQFKTLVLAYRAVKGTAPSYLQAMVKPYTPARPLRSAASGRLVAPSLRGPCCRSTRSRLFSVLAPQWWNELPTDVRTAESLPIFRRRLKTHLFKNYYPVTCS
ncbi:reverse transcriptase, partial [Pyricularia oryzae]